MQAVDPDPIAVILVLAQPPRQVLHLAPLVVEPNPSGEVEQPGGEEAEERDPLEVIEVDLPSGLFPVLGSGISFSETTNQFFFCFI